MLAVVLSWFKDSSLRSSLLPNKVGEKEVQQQGLHVPTPSAVTLRHTPLHPLSYYHWSILCPAALIGRQGLTYYVARPPRAASRYFPTISDDIRSSAYMTSLPTSRASCRYSLRLLNYIETHFYNISPP